MATLQLFSRLFLKTTTTATPISFLRRFSGAVITPPRSTVSLSLDDPFRYYSDLKSRNGCDYYHRRVIMQSLKGNPTQDEIIDGYIKTLADIVGSEDEARMMLYRVNTRGYHIFGTLLSDEHVKRIARRPRVHRVGPDPFIYWRIDPDLILNWKNKVYVDETFMKPPIPIDQLRQEWARRNDPARRQMVTKQGICGKSSSTEDAV